MLSEMLLIDCNYNEKNIIEEMMISKKEILIYIALDSAGVIQMYTITPKMVPISTNNM